MGFSDGYKRVTIWQPSSGYVADLYARDFKRAVTPVISREYFDAGDGSDYPIATNREFNIIAVNDEKLKHIQRMKALGCPVRFFAGGLGKHVLWLTRTAMDFVPDRPGAPDTIGDNLRFRNLLHYADIDDSPDLLGMFTFYGKSVLQDGSDYYLVGEDGLYAEHKWKITGATAAPTIDEYGRLVTDGVATLEFQFPIGGATLLLEEGGENADVSVHRVSVLNIEGGELDELTTDASGELHAATWALRVELSSIGAGTSMAVNAPILSVTDPGKYAGEVTPRVGFIPTSCALDDPEEVPPWAVTEIEVSNLYVWYTAGQIEMYDVQNETWSNQGSISDLGFEHGRMQIFIDRDSRVAFFGGNVTSGFRYFRAKRVLINSDGTLDMASVLTIVTDAVDAIAVDTINKRVFYATNAGTAVTSYYYCNYDGTGNTLIAAFTAESSSMPYNARALVYNENGDYLHCVRSGSGLSSALVKIIIDPPTASTMASPTSIPSGAEHKGWYDKDLDFYFMETTGETGTLAIRRWIPGESTLTEIRNLSAGIAYRGFCIDTVKKEAYKTQDNTTRAIDVIDYSGLLLRSISPSPNHSSSSPTAIAVL